MQRPRKRRHTRTALLEGLKIRRGSGGRCSNVVGIICLPVLIGLTDKPKSVWGGIAPYYSGSYGPAYTQTVGAKICTHTHTY